MTIEIRYLELDEKGLKRIVGVAKARDFQK